MDSNVVNANCVVHLCTGNDFTACYKASIPGNIQRDKRDYQTISEALKGRARGGFNDYTHLYRVRVDLFPNVAPRAGDKVFVSQHDTNPDMLGWWEIWSDPDHSNGLFASQKLYIHKEAL